MEKIIQKIDICCNHCGSRNVRRDAEAAWNLDSQEWELSTVFDSATCHDCGGKTSLREIPLPGRRVRHY